jgi:putative DNA primase/helicase
MQSAHSEAVMDALRASPSEPIWHSQVPSGAISPPPASSPETGSPTSPGLPSTAGVAPPAQADLRTPGDTSWSCAPMLNAIDTAVPTALRDLPRWVLWRSERPPGRKEPTKVPYRPAPGGEVKAAKTSDPSTWTTFDAASAGIERFDGLGIVLGDGLTGVDLDHCRNPETGELAEWATSALHCLSSYTEVSPSGTGLHILCFGSLPAGFRNRRALPHGGRIELYDSGRYFTFTGDHLPGTPKEVQERTAELATICEMFDLLPEAIEQEQKSAPPAVTPSHTPYLADEVLIQKMLASNQKARTLWQGDTTDHASDDSDADQALCAHLAFWTGRDPDAIDRLFRLSGLYRQKWERADYRERTIAKAIAFVSAIYTGDLKTGDPPPGDPPRTVRFARRLYELKDGPKLLAGLVAAGVQDDAAIAEIAGVTPRTVADWWRAIRKAQLEEIVRTRPSRSYVLVSEALLHDRRAAIQERVSGIHLRAFANNGVASVSGVALAAHRRLSRQTVSEHLHRLKDLGHVEITQLPFDADEGKQAGSNIYVLHDLVSAPERAAEARGCVSVRETRHALPSVENGVADGDQGPSPALDNELAAEGTAEAGGSVSVRETRHGEYVKPDTFKVYTAESSTRRSVVGCTQPYTELHGGAEAPSAVYAGSEEERVTHHSIPPPSAAKQPLQPTAAEGGQEGADDPPSRTHDRATLGQVQVELLRRGIPRRHMPTDVDIFSALEVTMGDLQAAVSLLLDDLRMKHLMPTLLQEETRARAPEDEPPAVIEPPPPVFTKQAVPPTGAVVPAARVVEIARQEGLDPEEAHWLIEAGRLEVETQVAEEVAV